MTKLTTAQRTEIRARHGDGETSLLLAMEFGVATRTVFRVCAKDVTVTVQDKRIKITPIQRDEIRAHHAEGVTAKALALKFGVTTRTIFRAYASPQLLRVGIRPCRNRKSVTGPVWQWRGLWRVL